MPRVRVVMAMSAVIVRFTVMSIAGVGGMSRFRMLRIAGPGRRFVGSVVILTTMEIGHDRYV